MFIKLIRLGRDAELRSTPAGKQLCNFAGAYDVGYGDNKRTQWIDCTLWGDRAQKVVGHLTKGTQIVICGDDLEVETFQKNDQTQGVKLKCRVVSFDFAGGITVQREQVQPPVQQAPTQQQAPAGFDEFDDDIPF